MSVVLGKNVLVYFFDDFWKPAVCGRDCSFNTNSESIETSITNSGISRTFEYGAFTWGCSIDGLIYLQMTNTIALPDIRLWQYTRQKVLLRYQRTDQNGSVYLEEGTGLIETVTDTGPQDGAATFSIQIKGSGPLTQVFTPTPVDPTGKVKRYPDIDDELITVDGQMSFTSPLLIGKKVLEVHKDGIGNAKLISSGTPVNKEAKVDNVSGTITFGVPFVSTEQAYVLYQDM